MINITKKEFVKLYLFNVNLFNKVDSLTNREEELIMILILEDVTIDKDRKYIEESMKLSKSNMSILLKSLVNKKYISYKLYELNPSLLKLKNYLKSNPTSTKLNYDINFIV